MNLLRQLPLPHFRSTGQRLAGGLTLITFVALNLLQLGFPAGVARAAAYPCTEAGLDAALATGGVATFTCGAPTTITLTTAKTVSVSGTVLDGGALLTLDGRNVANSMFAVPAGVTATFQNMELTKGTGQPLSGNYYGGAIFTRGTVNLFNDIFSNNGISTNPNTYGGAIYSEGSLTVQNSTFYGNQAYFGGAIIALYTNIDIANSTFTTNSGGYIVQMGGNVSSSTIYGNVGVNLGSGSTVNVKNSVIGNFGGGGTFNNQGNNLVGTNPRLNALANNGGFVPTMSPQPCSPVINAGNSAGAPATDERGTGFPRVLQGAMDIGAFESSLLPCVSVNNVSLAEGTAGTTNFNFTVSLSGAASNTITVDYATADGTATTADNDYTATSGTLTFAPGTTTQTVTVPANGDTKFEPNETFTLNLSNPTNVTLATNGTGTIVNDDTLPTISIGDVSQVEGNSGTTAYVFTAVLSAASSQTVTIDYATANGTANAPGDYTSSSGTLTFTPGTTTQTVTVLVNGDTTTEPNETFFVNLTNITGAIASDGLGVGTIVNDDAPPTISINNVTQNEGNSGTTAFNFTVSLSNLTSQIVTVDYSTADGTATIADSDYAAATGTLTIPPGQSTRTITVNVNGDTTFEPNETFTVNLSNPTNATLGTAKTGTGTINNDDSQPTVSVNNVNANESNTGTTAFNFTVSLSGPTNQAITVDYATADGSATTADNDYAATTGTLTIPAGQTSGTITVNVNGDTKFEPDETFSLALSAPTNATLGTLSTGTGTIVNDDSVPTVSINSVSLAEGNSGTTAFNFTVSLSSPTSQPVSLDFATADGTATTADSDYQGQFGPLTIPAGQTTATITVNVNGDTKLEPDETFTVVLSNPINATFGTATGTGTILNDDTQPTISIGNVTLAEGNSGTTAFNFTVSLSNATSQAVTVDYATADSTATTADNDYAATTGTLTIPAGQTSGTITANVNGDTKFEPDETFTVALSNPANAKLGVPSTGTGTILNDDGVPALSIAGVTQAEGNTGTTAFNFTVTLSNPTAQAVTVNYATADGTATIADNDYAAATGTLTIPAGQTTGTITVNVNGDTKFEPNETFTVNLNSPSGATLGTASTATGTITNDDGVPTVSIADVSQAEGNSGTTAFNFSVTLSAVSAQPVVVQYATADGSATTTDNDYAATNGTLTIPAGQTTGTITVNVNGDTKVEPNETFTVSLTNPTGAILGKATGTGTITNDDSPPPPTTPAVSVGDVRQREGNSGTTTFNFTVRLSVATSNPVTVNYATLDDTATVADNDYQPTSGTLTFAPGETAKTVTVVVNGDTKIEPDEVFLLVLTNPVGANLGKGTAQGVILNDDGETDEADLIGKLRVTPDREFDLDGNGLLTYVLTVKNIGLGASSPPAVQLPIDSSFQVAYASFTTDSVPGAFYEKTVTDPVSAVLPYAVLPYAQLRLPVLAPGQAVTATIALKAVAGAKPSDLNTRFAIVWDNLDGKPHHYYSNRVHLHLSHGTTRNETDGLVQFLGLVAAGNGLDEQGRATVQLAGDIYAPGERVYLWYTDANGKSTGLGYVWADLHTGELNTQLVIPGWQSGQRYFLAALGDRSGVIGSATVLVQSRATTQNLAENGSATNSGYNYAEVAPLFDNEALQIVLKGLTTEE